MKRKSKFVLPVHGLRKDRTSHERPRVKVTVLGKGEPVFDIPDSKTLVERGIEIADDLISEKTSTSVSASIEGKEGEDASLRHSILDGGWDPWYLQRYLKKQHRAEEIGTLVKCADGLQRMMADRHLDGLVYDRFDTMLGIVAWAKKNMAAKYQPAIESLSAHLEAIVARYQEALPQLVDALASRYPKKPVPELFEFAVRTLDKELRKILFVLNIYADSFGQYRNGIYTDKLALVNYFLEQAFLLFQSVDLEDAYDNCGIPEAKVPTTTFNVGDVYLSRFTVMPLSTIPAANGPLDIHALQLPFEMLELVAIMIPLLAHELRHNIFFDVPGMEEELIDCLVENIVGAWSEKRFQLSSESIDFAGQKLKAIDVITKFFVDTLPEVDADYCGGVLFSGPAYLYSMLASFPAMMVRDRPIANAASLLRSDSIYFLDQAEEGAPFEISFESHPPDYLRAILIAEALKQMGFLSEAEKLMTIADKAVGSEIPEFFEFYHAEGEFEGVIKIPVADMRAVAAVIASTLIFQPLESLGGLSNFDCVNFDEKRQAKVDLLAGRLMRGWSTLPKNAGHFFPSYVGSAAMQAFWKKVEQGVEPHDAASCVNKTALRMIANLKRRCEPKTRAA